jgi:hypothetical protein
MDRCFPFQLSERASLFQWSPVLTSRIAEMDTKHQLNFERNWLKFNVIKIIALRFSSTFYGGIWGWLWKEDIPLVVPKRRIFIPNLQLQLEFLETWRFDYTCGSLYQNNYEKHRSFSHKHWSSTVRLELFW